MNIDLTKPVCGHGGETTLCIRAPKHSGSHSYRLKEWYERKIRHQTHGGPNYG